MGFFSIYGKAIMILASILITIGASYFAYNHYYPKGLIADLVARETAMVVEQYESDLAAKDKEITIIQDRLKLSQSKVAQLNKKIKDLEGQIQNVQKPTTTNEVKDRLRALGYPPLR